MNASHSHCILALNPGLSYHSGVRRHTHEDDVFTIRPINDNHEHQDWLAGFLAEQWGSPRMVTRGALWDASALPGFAAVKDADLFGDAPVIGVATYHIVKRTCELTTLNSVQENSGVGTALVEAVTERARAAGCKTLIVVTTNDNLRALRFYQRRGFVIAAVRVNEMARSRQVKPDIPLMGFDGIPLRDEIELEKALL
ncbi:MAG: GNAT family N-acetyltransferase [bacterium]|nr:GNAT family N-acetyltransferase [bacterium]